MEEKEVQKTLTINYLTRKFRFDIELLVWFAFYVILNYHFIVAYFLPNNHSFAELLARYDVTVFFGLFLIIFPVVYSQIFGEFPFRHIGTSYRRRQKRKEEYLERLRKREELGISGDSNLVIQQSNTGELDHSAEDEETPEEEAIELLDSLVYKSSNLSNRIYQRSGVYLLIGSMIALGGIVYFSFRAIEIETELSYLNLLFAFLPRLGALFFIEFIAFFFLKQYRITMDDFKYYEAISRQRENNLLKLKLHMKNENISSDQVQKIVDSFDFVANPTVMNKDQTSESIEHRRLSNEELAIFEKITNAITAKINK